MDLLTDYMNNLTNKDLLYSILMAYGIYELCKGIATELSNILFENYFDNNLNIGSINIDLGRLMKRVFIFVFIFIITYLLINYNKSNTSVLIDNNNSNTEVTKNKKKGGRICNANLNTNKLQNSSKLNTTEELKLIPKKGGKKHKIRFIKNL